VDDFHLPLGTLRLRQRGSSGGHNGLYSIIYHLQSDEFPRLRFGIAAPSMPKEKSKMADFVLCRFDDKEITEVNKARQAACDAIIHTLPERLETAMNRFNTIIH
ncbi:MAG: aminoacyl-tRNA hydrolase, partial [Ignavibacteriales bacterium]|nr:aminoacyl-tRNA hydrolase [Ignavibacteriales bacterium]